MNRRSLELSRLAFALFVRGVLLVLLGALAIRWPRQYLLLGMVVAGGVVGSIGIFEIAAASVSRALPSSKLFYAAHGLISIALGALTATIPVARIGVALALCLGFLTVYAAFSFVLAARLQFVRRARATLVGWGMFNVACALFLAVGESTLSDLIYAGALYGTLLGGLQLAAAVWIHRGQTSLDRLATDAPLGAPR